MSKGIVDALYYRLYNAILLGESQDAKLNLELLREEYLQNSDNFSLLQEDDRFDNLRQLANLVDNGLVVRNINYSSNTSETQTAEKDDKQAETEVELIKLIFTNEKNLRNLRDCLNVSESFRLENIQHPTKFGRIDVLAFENETVYAIEIKKSEARYSVISQIEKYVLDLKLKLILKMWKRVVGVVIANGYVDQVVKELVKSGVVAIKYTLENEVISFRRLNAKEENCDIGNNEIGRECPEETRKETAVTKSTGSTKVKNRR